MSLPRGARARERRVLATLCWDPQASPNVLTFLLASRKMSSTLNSTALCREADVPLFMIPSDPVPEMDKLKTSWASEIHSTFPSLRIEAWEWLRGCKQLNLKVETATEECVPGSPYMQEMDIPLGLFAARLSISFRPFLISSIFALGGSSQAGSFIQRGYCWRS